MDIDTTVLGVGSASNPPRLCNKNHFYMWKTRIMDFLESNLLLETIWMGPHIPPMEQTKWSDEDRQKVALEAKAKYILTVSLPDDIYSFVMYCESAKEMWDNLMLLFEGTDVTRAWCRRRSLLIHEYNLFKHESGESLTPTFDLNHYRISGMAFERYGTMFEQPILYGRKSFSIWKKRMIAFMNFTNSYFLETITKGPHIPLMEKSKWSDEDKQKVRLDREAKYTLMLSLPNNIFDVVMHSNSAKEMWDNLILHFEGTDISRAYHKCLLMEQYDAFTYEDGETVTQTYMRFNCLINELKEHNKTFDNKVMLIKFLESVHPSLKHVCIIISSFMNLETMSLQSIYGTLLVNEIRLNHDALKMKENESYKGGTLKIVEVQRSAKSEPKQEEVRK